MTYSEMQKKIEDILEKYDAVNIYTSPDFQCEQTSGFPCSLCVCWDKGKAWLELNSTMIADGEDVSYYEQCCADFGIRDCYDQQQYNDILKSLGKEAYDNAMLPDDDEGEVMKLC